MPLIPTGSRTIFEGRRVRLEVGNESSDVIRSWLPDLRQLGLLSFRPGFETPVQAAGELDGLLSQSIIALVLDRTMKKPCGFVCAYDLKPEAAWGFCLSYVISSARGQLIGIEASYGFWDYLFAQLDLDKIYLDVAEFNSDWLTAFPGIEIGLFTEEGRFRDHLRYADRTWDVVRLAVYRERFAILREIAFRIFSSATERGRTAVEREGGSLIGAELAET